MRTVRWRTTACRIVLVLVVATGVVAVTGMPASAATCSGAGCNYQDPLATGCSADAVTVAHVQLPWVAQRLELRWSPSCHTNWARMYLDTAPTWLRAIQPDRGDGLPRVTQMIGHNDIYSWSAMIYSPVLCVYADVQTAVWGRYRTACV